MSLLKNRWVRRLGILVILALALSAGGALGVVTVVSRDLPDLNSLKDYDPPTTSRVFDARGELVARFYAERRTVAPVERIPAHVKNAFIAAEDAEFYQHEGVDWVAVFASVLNEVKVKMFGGSRRGGSTITQQTAKTFLLSPERTYSRKLKEMILAKRIEENLTKDEILHLYLNQIYFGHGAYGVEEAARTYYGKSVTQLTLGQAAALASVPKSPSRINPFADPKRVRARRAYVLGQMVSHKFATEEEKAKAEKEPVRVYVDKPEFLGSAPYYAEEIRRRLAEKYGDDVVNKGGLKVYAALDARLQVTAKRAVEDGLRAVDKRQGWRGPVVRLDPDEAKMFLEALGSERTRRFPKEETPELAGKADGRPIWDLSKLTEKKLQRYLGLIAAASDVPPDDEDEANGEPEPETERFGPMRSVRTQTARVGERVAGVVAKIDDSKKVAWIDLGTMEAKLPLKHMKWARAFNTKSRTPAPKKPGAVLKRGDVVLVHIEELSGEGKDAEAVVSLDQEPRAEGAFVAVDPHSHRVLALVGGYDFDRSSFNRATQAKRQPGSSFKPLIYALGVETKAFTPVGFLTDDGSRMITDAPKVYFDRWTNKKWEPQNSGGRFRGDITLRTCLTYSVNTCSISILEKVGVEEVHALAEKVGVKTAQTPLPANLTLALGTGEVIPLDMVNAYTIFPGEGQWAPPILIEKVKTGDGQVLTEASVEPVQVISKGSAYVMSEMMKSVVENGTATRAKALGKIVAGKTGTTNSARSVWFIGFSPDVVAGAYVGFDNNDPLGRAEYGGKAALPIWMDFMKVALEGDEERDFVMPEGVVKKAIDKKKGLLVRLEEEGGEDIADPTEPTPTTTDDGDEPKLPEGAIWEYFVEGTEPMTYVEEAAPPPLELLEGGGLGP
jgi:penicillin-binding protein 1A